MAVRKTEEGAKLKRWFKEKWVDVRTGKPCGRQKGEKRSGTLIVARLNGFQKTPQNSVRAYCS